MHPLLYQINTRCFLQELELGLRRPATLDDFPDERLDRLAACGMDYVWLLGVWQTGLVGLKMARGQRELRKHYRRLVPDLTDDDVVSSPFAVQSYEVARELGGSEAMVRMHKRMTAKELRLVLDFVPNHTAIDHPWVFEHPERYVHGTEEDLAHHPENFVRITTRCGARIIALGRDPNFIGWCDTLQLNYASESCRQAVLGEIQRIAQYCDGLRCDMAMLLEPDVFARTWGARMRPADGSAPALRPFWPEVIATIRKSRPDFLFIAEVYWDGMDWRLQQQGFDYTYDKRLYDRLREGRARPARDHLCADASFQNHSLRFLENHDEARAARVFEWPVHRAAAVISMLVPGMGFLHEGQLEGRKEHVPMQFRRRPSEPAEPEVHAFYEELLACARRLEVRRGVWTLWACRPAWDGNATWDHFIVFTWSLGERWMLVVVNYGPCRAQCYARIGLSGLRGRMYELVDQLSEARYERSGDSLAGVGLYLDVPGWGVHVFAVQPIG